MNKLVTLLSLLVAACASAETVLWRIEDSATCAVIKQQPRPFAFDRDGNPTVHLPGLDPAQRCWRVVIAARPSFDARVYTLREDEARDPDTSTITLTYAIVARPAAEIAEEIEAEAAARIDAAVGDARAQRAAMLAAIVALADERFGGEIDFQRGGTGRDEAARHAQALETLGPLRDKFSAAQAIRAEAAAKLAALELGTLPNLDQWP